METRMRAAVLSEPGKLVLTERPKPVPRAGEVRIRVERTGICGSDLSFFTGKRAFIPGAVLGHEIVGVVDAAGPGVERLSPGDRVAVEPNFPCFECPTCRRGAANVCPRKRTLGLDLPGGFAEFVVAPERFAWPLPEGVPFADAVLIEPLAVAARGLRTGHVEPGQSIAVIGSGFTGQLLALLAESQGVRVTALDTDPDRLRWTASFTRADTVHVPAVPDAAFTGKLKERLAAQGVDAIFECAGRAAAVQLALEVAPPGSPIVLQGLATDEVRFQPLDFVRRGLALYSSLIYEHPVDFPAVLDLLARGVLRPGAAVWREMPLDGIQEAFEAALGRAPGKVVVRIG